MIRISHPTHRDRNSTFWILHRDRESFDDPQDYLGRFRRWEKTWFWADGRPSLPFYWAITGYGPFVFPMAWTEDDLLDISEERPSMMLTRVDLDSKVYRAVLDPILTRAANHDPPSPRVRFNPLKSRDAFRLSEVLLSANPDRFTWDLEHALENRHSPRALVETFADSGNEEIRRKVAHNMGISLEVLERLASDPSRDVRIAAAQNRRATPDMLRRLSEDEDEHVRAVTVAHSNTPIESIRRLGESDEFFGLFLAQNPSIPSDIALPQFERIVNLGSDYERGMIAVHPALSAELADRLAASDNPTVRASIAVRLDLLSPETCERLAHDPDSHVQFNAVSYLPLADETLEMLALHSEHDVRIAAKRRLAHSDDPGVG